MKTKEEVQWKIQKIELGIVLPLFVIILIAVYLLKINMLMNVILLVLTILINFFLDPILKNIAIHKFPNVPHIETLRLSKPVKKLRMLFYPISIIFSAILLLFIDPFFVMVLLVLLLLLSNSMADLIALDLKIDNNNKK